MIALPRERRHNKRWNCRWPNCANFAQPRKRSICTLHYQLYLCRQINNAAESLPSICNNSANNEPCDVSAVGNVGGDSWWCYVGVFLIVLRSINIRRGFFPGAITLMYFFQTKDVSFDCSHRWKLCLVFGWSSRQIADLPWVFAATKNGARSKICGECLGGWCCAHLLTEWVLLLLETSGSASRCRRQSAICLKFPQIKGAYLPLKVPKYNETLAPCVGTVFCRRGRCQGWGLGNMLRSTGTQGCEILLHCRAGVVVASLVVRRRARARGVGSWQTAGAVDGRAGGRRLIALRLPLLSVWWSAVHHPCRRGERTHCRWPSWGGAGFGMGGTLVLADGNRRLRCYIFGVLHYLFRVLIYQSHVTE